MIITDVYEQTKVEREYFDTFWNRMKGRKVDDKKISTGRVHNGGFTLPYSSYKKYQELKDKEDTFYGIMTRVEVLDKGRIFVSGEDHTASWIPEAGEIPGFNADGDYMKYEMPGHKLAAVVRISDDFVNSSSFNLEDNVLRNFAVAMSRAEEQAFITGNGTEMPYGLLHEERGAEVGVTAQSLTYDDVVKLFFSVKAKYRKKGKWIMNDETAHALRSIKDKDGNYLWNHSDDNILGKEVLISEFMPTEGTPILFGDLRYYRIIDRCRINIRELMERFAYNNEIGYVGYEYVDGMLTKREAVKAFKIS